MPSIRTLSQRRTFAGDLLNVAGHELRSPLTALRAYADLLFRHLSETGEMEASRQDAMEMMHLITRLDHEIEMYTVAGHLARGTFALSLSRANLDTLMASAVSQYVVAASGGRIGIEGGSGGTTLRMMDVKRFEMALGLLLLQACVATEQSTPTLGLSRMGTVAAITISDAGPLPAPVAAAIELPPHTLPAPSEASLLQMAVVREVIEAHGGHLQGYAGDGGYVITITLPGLLALSSSA